MFSPCAEIGACITVLFEVSLICINEQESPCYWTGAIYSFINYMYKRSLNVRCQQSKYTSLFNGVVLNSVLPTRVLSEVYT